MERYVIMSKNREAVTCNGRAAFYACMWDDIRQCAMDCGWAVGLHGSLNSDMDIMAMPWVETSTTFEELVARIVTLFSGNMSAENYCITYNEKPHNRIVATIPIFADFYLDISTIKNTSTDDARIASWKNVGYGYRYKCSNCQHTEDCGYPARGFSLGKFCPTCGFKMTNPQHICIEYDYD